MTPNRAEPTGERNLNRVANFQQGGRTGSRWALLIVIGAAAAMVVIMAASFVGLAQSPGFEVSRRLPLEYPSIVQRAFYVAGVGERLVVEVRPGVSPEQATRFGCEVVRPQLRENGLPIVFVIQNASRYALASHLSPCTERVPSAPL
jgi:hypothetical protein